MNLTMNIFRHDLFFSLLLSYHAYTIVRPFFKFRAASASPPRPPSPSYHIVAILSFVQLATRCFPPTPFDTFVSSLSLSHTFPLFFPFLSCSAPHPLSFTRSPSTHRIRRTVVATTRRSK